MKHIPSTDDLRTALAAAGAAHHEFEQNYLQGIRDEQWSGWYAAFVIGRLGAFATPTELTHWLEKSPGGEDWASTAATYVSRQLGSG